MSQKPNNGHAKAPPNPLAPTTDELKLLAEVEALMAELVRGDGDDPLGPILERHLKTGGKRLRARLALTATEALGGDRRRAIPWAAACELLHNATLVHDDLQDGDTHRRGEETVWVTDGPAQAINAGDLMLMLPYAALARVDTDDTVRAGLTDVLTRHAVSTVRGQAIELALLADGVHDGLRDAYLRGVEGKTSALFKLPVEGGALIAGLDRAAARRTARTFERLGTLFQFQDDVLDLYGDKGRDVRGADLREGKVSFLVVEHLRLHPADADWLLDLLLAPRAETPDDGVERAIAAFKDGGALGAVVAEIKSIADGMLRDEDLVAAPVLHALAKRFIDVVLAPIAHVMDIDGAVDENQRSPTKTRDAAAV